MVKALGSHRFRHPSGRRPLVGERPIVSQSAPPRFGLPGEHRSRGGATAIHNIKLPRVKCAGSVSKTFTRESAAGAAQAPMWRERLDGVGMSRLHAVWLTTSRAHDLKQAAKELALRLNAAAGTVKVSLKTRVVIAKDALTLVLF